MAGAQSQSFVEFFITDYAKNRHFGKWLPNYFRLIDFKAWWIIKKPTIYSTIHSSKAFVLCIIIRLTAFLKMLDLATFASKKVFEVNYYVMLCNQCIPIITKCKLTFGYLPSLNFSLIVHAVFKQWLKVCQKSQKNHKLETDLATFALKASIYAYGSWVLTSFLYLYTVLRNLILYSYPVSIQWSY